MTETFDEIVENRRTLVCCGSGGVGKTTTAAVIAMHAARHGRKAVVVTIDPARRLANALGLDEISDEEHEIETQMWDPDGTRVPGGSLSAVMLDAKSTFDQLVYKYSADPEQAERILSNRVYQNLTSALSGTQEYMAMEKLYELHEENDYDLVVVDTPPSRNALDFLEAPNRLTQFLEGRFFRVLTAPARGGMRIVNRATRGVLKAVGRIIGSEVLQDVVDFFAAFEGMYEGFHDRAARVKDLLSAEGTAFLLVASPRQDAMREAEYFAGTLSRMGYPIAGAIVNRLHPRFSDTLAEATRARSETFAHRVADGDTEPAVLALSDLYANLASFQEIAQREENHLDTLRNLVEPSPTARVPFLGDDVHDFRTLRMLEEKLFEQGAA